ncbi:MAG: hypothetical protein FJ295_20360 [Planctomycetes bacterium]|nr:hypothetical protein [Planctomycetota bacterium]
MFARIQIGIVLSIGWFVANLPVSGAFSQDEAAAPPAATAAATTQEKGASVPVDPKIASMLEQARSTYVPLTDERVGEAKRQLQRDLRELDQRLIQSGQERRADWHKFLMWSELQQQIAAAKIDASTMRTILGRFTSGEPGMEWEPVARARQSLRSFLHLALLKGDERARDSFEAALTELAKRHEAFAASGQWDDAVALGRAVGWLDRSRMATDLVAAIHQKFGHSNLQIHVSRRLAASGVEDDVEDTMPVSENILGTQLEGTAHTKGRISLALMPDSKRASMRILLNAKTESNNVGYHGPVTIFSRGWTDVSVFKNIHIDSTGIADEMAHADCDTTTVIDDIQSQICLIEKLAWKQAAKKKEQSEAIGNHRAEVRVAGRVDSQAAEMLEKARDSFEKKFRAPLLRRDAFPRRLAMATSESALTVDVLQLGANQLAATGSPPAVTSGDDLHVQLHESFAGNLSEGALGGTTLTDEKVESMIQEQTGNVPEELKVTPDKDPWSITFAADQPVSTQFAAEGVTISIRGRKFTRGDQEITDPIKVSATYAIEKTATGAKLTRKGDVEIDYIGHKGNLSVKQVAFKTFMRRKFEALLKSEIVSDGIKLPGRWEHAGKLVVQQMQSGNGWLTLGWNLEKAPVVAEQPKPASQVVATP